MQTIYFDYNATTPLDPEVRQAMEPCLAGEFGNPSSVHRLGRSARAALDQSRERVAAVWKCKPSEVIFTSGGTESNNLAVLGTARKLRTRGKHLLTSSIEHHAVLHSFQYLEKEGFEVTYLPVDRTGRVDPAEVTKAFRPDTTLVSIMAANNETGACQEIQEIGRLCRDRGVLFHTDAVQFFGKEPFESIAQFEADLVSICAHKIHGPKGAGSLYVRSPFAPDPILFGGSHENERRAGTENLAGIVGLAETVERFLKPPVFPGELRRLCGIMIQALEKMEGVSIQTRALKSLPNTVAFTVAGADSIALLAALDLEGICASSGSACSAGSLEPSHVLRAMGVGREESNALVRFSLGRESTAAEVARVLEVLPGLLKRVAGR